MLQFRIMVGDVIWDKGAAWDNGRSLKSAVGLCSLA
jgi:hypothetical protein